VYACIGKKLQLTWMPCSRQYSYNVSRLARQLQERDRVIRVGRYSSIMSPNDANRAHVLTSQQELAIWQPAWPTVMKYR
jgi:hypothetical protein